MTMVLFVYHVVLDVTPVKEVLVTVLNVLKEEFKTLLLVAHVMMVCMIKTEFVTIVTINVKNVLSLLLIVILVLILEKINQPVIVQMDTSILIKFQNVNHVLINV
jgi:hypothetical protein